MSDENLSGQGKTPLQIIPKILLIIFSICFIASVAILYVNEIRPFAYYVIVTVMASILLLEIIMFGKTGQTVTFILMQVGVLAMDIIWSASLNYYYYIGRTDILVHAWFAENLIDIGHVTELFDTYQGFPLWHILTDMATYVMSLDLPANRTMTLVNGLIYGILAIFCMYAVARKLSGDTRIALLSALFLAVNPSFIEYGMYSISRSVASALFVVLILILLKERKSNFLILLGILTVSLVIYHTVTIIFVVFILAIVYVLQKIFPIEKGDRMVTLTYLVATVLFTVAYWSLYANNVVHIVYSDITGQASLSGLSGAILQSPVNELINYLQYSVWLIFVLFAIMVVLGGKKYSNLIKFFSIIALIMIPLSFPGPLLLINKLAQNFNIERFAEYSFVFICLMAAIGFKEFFNISNRGLKAFAIILFAVMVLLSVSNDFVASDNPLVKRPFYTFYLGYDEVAGFNTLANHTEGYVMTDYIAIRYIENSEEQGKPHILEVNMVNNTLLRNNSSDTILIRQGEIEKRPVKLFAVMDGKYIRMPNWGNEVVYFYNTTDYINKDLNRVYDSRTILGFN